MQISLVNMEFSLYKRAPVPPLPFLPLIFAFRCALLLRKSSPIHYYKTVGFESSQTHTLIFEEKSSLKIREAPARSFLVGLKNISIGVKYIDIFKT